jgi:hypothetical protein
LKQLAPLVCAEEHEVNSEVDSNTLLKIGPQLMGSIFRTNEDNVLAHDEVNVGTKF